MDTKGGNTNQNDRGVGMGDFFKRSAFTALAAGVYVAELMKHVMLPTDQPMPETPKCLDAVKIHSMASIVDVSMYGLRFKNSSSLTVDDSTAIEPDCEAIMQKFQDILHPSLVSPEEMAGQVMEGLGILAHLQPDDPNKPAAVV